MTERVNAENSVGEVRPCWCWLLCDEATPAAGSWSWGCCTTRPNLEGR